MSYLNPGRVRILVGDLRLPRDERRAARAERRVEAQMRAERDWRDERQRRRLAAEAEGRRWGGPPGDASGGGLFGGG